MTVDGSVVAHAGIGGGWAVEAVVVLVVVVVGVGEGALCFVVPLCCV